MQAQGGYGGKSPNHSQSRRQNGVIGGQHRVPAALLPGKTQYPSYKRLGDLGPGLDGHGRPPLTGIRFSDRPAYKSTAAPPHVTKTHRGSRGTAPLIFNLGTRLRWLASRTCRPRVPKEQEVRRATALVWGSNAKMLCPSRNSNHFSFSP
jgi:hypothetical protein